MLKFRHSISGSPNLLENLQAFLFVCLKKIIKFYKRRVCQWPMGPSYVKQLFGEHGRGCHQPCGKWAQFHEIRHNIWHKFMSLFIQLTYSCQSKFLQQWLFANIKSFHFLINKVGPLHILRHSMLLLTTIKENVYVHVFFNALACKNWLCIIKEIAIHF